MVQWSDIQYIARKIGELIRDVQEAEQLLKQRKERLRCLPIPTMPAERLELARLLYWQHPEVTSTAIAEMLDTTAHEMTKAIGPCSSGVLCDRCRQDIPATSRTALADLQRQDRKGGRQYAEGYGLLCRSCHDAVMEARKEARVQGGDDEWM